MSDLWYFFSEEQKRFCGITNMAVWGSLIILLLIIGFKNISEYKSLSTKEVKFKELQNNYFNSTHDYAVYSRTGIMSMFISSPVSILCRNAIVPPDVISKVDPVVLLNIFNNLKGKALAPGNLNFQVDFSTIILLFLTLLGLYYGYETMQAREYFKFRASIKSHPKIFLGVIFSKYILFILSFLILHALLIIQVLLFGIHIPALDYANLVKSLPASLLLLLFFFITGVLIGTLRLQGFKSALSIFAAWFFLIYIIPGIINFQIEHAMPESSEDYQTELEKFSVVVQFEKKAIEEKGIFDRNNIENERKGIEQYWNNDYKKIEAREENLKKKFVDFVDDYYFLSLFFPTTHFLSTMNEVSSRGYENFLAYYGFNQDLQRKFVRFYIDRTFYNDPRVMANFLDKEDPIYRAKSSLPHYFHAGNLVNSIYCILLLFIAYYRYKKYLFPIPQNAHLLKTIDFNFEKGNVYMLRTADNDFFEQFLNPFFGINQYFPGKITIAGENMITAQKKDIIYLPGLASIPEDIPVKSIVKLFAVEDLEFMPIINKKFGELKLFEKLELLLTGARLKRAGITIIKELHDVRDEYWAQYIKRINDLRENGTVIYLGSIERTYIPGALDRDIVYDNSANRYVVSEISVPND